MSRFSFGMKEGLLLGFLVVIIGGAVVVSAWTAPGSNPPNGNVSPTLISMWVATTSNGIYYNAGNVGFGTLNPLASVDAGTGNVKSWGHELAATGSYLGFNIYYGSNWTYRTTDSGYVIRHDGSDLGFYYAPSGTAGSTATPVQVMAIKNTGYVGIGTTSPSAPLEVAGASNCISPIPSKGGIALWHKCTEGAAITMNDDATNPNTLVHLENLNGAFRVLNSPWNQQMFSVDQTGNMTVTGTVNSNSPVFKATQGYVASNAGWAAYSANFKMTKVIDTANAYNASTGIFTAPIAGYYNLSFSIAASQASTATINDIGLVYNGSANESVFPVQTQTFPYTGWWNDWSYSAPVYMGVGDTVSVMHECCSTSGTVSAWRGFFSGYYLHP